MASILDNPQTVYRRHLFDLPDNIIYLDGNSLGPMPKAVAGALEQVMHQEWANGLIRSWNDAGWISLADRTAAKIATLIGARDECVSVGDTTSVNLFKLLTAAIDLRPQRKIILSEKSNFPGDLYVASQIVRRYRPDLQLVLAEKEELPSLINEQTALLMLSDVDFKSGYRHDVYQITRLAHRFGTLTLWDLSHSAGAIFHKVEENDIDFAVGCGYKYLNGGPGAPAFCYVSPRHLNHFEPILCGWFGHADPFAFEPEYRPARGTGRLKVGTPSILSLAALHEALEIFHDVDMKRCFDIAIELGDTLVNQINKRCTDVRVITPSDPQKRGSHVAISFANAYALSRALTDRGVICDFREPDVVRFAITPLYLSNTDIGQAAEIIGETVSQKTYQDKKYQRRSYVT